MRDGTMSHGGLTPKRRAFVDEYLVDMNATAAATRAGYSRRRAAEIGWQLLQKTTVRGAIATAQDARAKRTGITADRVLCEFAKLGFANLGQFASWDDSGVRLIPSSEVDPAALLEVVSTASEYGTSVRVKLHDKLGPLNSMGKHLGLFVKKVEVTHPGLQGALATLAEMSPEQIRESLAVVAALRAARQESGGEDDDGDDGDGDGDGA